MRCKTWGERSATWHAKEQMEKHQTYIDVMRTTGHYWYGTPPRSKFLNWLAHKLLELAWGRSLYL